MTFSSFSIFIIIFSFHSHSSDRWYDVYGIGTVSNHPKHNHSSMYCCCWQFLITSTHFFLSFISGIIVIIGFVISVNFLSRYCLPLVLLCKFILQIESHTFSFPFIPFCILKLFPFVIGIMQYGFFVVCVCRAVVILLLVIVVFNCITLAFNAVKQCKHEHICRVHSS